MSYGQEAITGRQAITSRIVPALQRWLDSYLVWHSPQLAVAAMQAMAEERRKQRMRNGVCEGEMVQCHGHHLAAACAGAVHKYADI